MAMSVFIGWSRPAEKRSNSTGLISVPPQNELTEIVREDDLKIHKLK